ncbi:alpha/beta hydrolase [Kribbella catacumbae]|uniref:alpha/beta hydrolase n=1 Tax=Kribbella catacumbae TaxID=460086 RepID=UPI0003644654|nr:alpha/beta hydrolase [Kribbella catacumbae]
MDTAESRYDRLTDRVAALYDEGLQRVALDLMDAAEPDLQPWVAELAHLRACLLGSLGESTEAVAALQQASDAGGWWDEGILTEDDDLAALQPLPAFQNLVAISRSRRITSQDEPLIQLPTTPPCGVVVALHGAGQRASHAMRDWAGVLDLGYALVGVESSQLMSPMYRTWPEPELASKDVARALDQFPQELRGLPLIAAGFSAGGRVALDWALTGQPERAAGVVVLAPALRELPAEAQAPLSPATILIGTEDDLLEVVDEAAAQLTAFGLTIHKLPALGHEIPADLTDQLRALLPGIDA